MFDSPVSGRALNTCGRVSLFVHLTTFNCETNTFPGIVIRIVITIIKIVIRIVITIFKIVIRMIIRIIIRIVRFIMITIV